MIICFSTLWVCEWRFPQASKLIQIVIFTLLIVMDFAAPNFP
jgi:hypothetical protein